MLFSDDGTFQREEVYDEDEGLVYPEPDEAEESTTDLGGDPRSAVCEWHIEGVGRRPLDFMARDCLLSALFRDPRVPWFHRFVRKPIPWMTDLVTHIEDEHLRKQALQLVVLHYLHKRHLARVYAYELEYNGDPEGVELKWLKRLWDCPPYGVLIRRRGSSRTLPGCGLSRVCPWCHARKVVQLHECLKRGPLSNPSVTHFWFGKASLVREPTGVEEFAPYTRKELAEDMFAASDPLGIANGIWTHQLGPCLQKNGLPTFTHDISLIGQADAASFDRMERIEEGKVFGGGYMDVVGLEEPVFWNLLPVRDPAALRVALAGSTLSYSVENLGLDSDWVRNHHGYTNGIRGALGWQPTFLVPPRLWSTYAGVMRHQRLYQAFGTWKQSLGRASRESRETIDKQFACTHQTGRLRDRQQRGNRRRHRQSEDRRQDLLASARRVWDEVRTQARQKKGRPAYRAQLKSMLDEQGITVSRRDLDWLMKELQ